MKQKITLLIPALCLIASNVFGQLNVKDSTVGFWMFNPQISYHLPGNDMKERFYSSGSIGFGVFYKTNTNWIFGIDAGNIFAEKVKNESSILSNITTREGFVIDKTGVFANIYFRERGFYSTIKTGKIFPVIGPNKNSGLLFLAGIGMMQHRIRIEVQENTAPQLQDDYLKGYDKLTNGLCISQFIGYINTSNNKLTNFYIGFEFIQGFTQSRRDYDFVLMAKDDKKRFDTLYGVKLGWNIPVYRRNYEKYYID